MQVVAGTMLIGQSGIAQEDNFGRYGMISVLFDSYPKARRIEASRLKVTAHDPNAPQVKPPYTAPQPVSRQITKFTPITKGPQEALTLTYKARISPPTKSIKTSKEKALATRQALVQSFPAQEDRDAEEAYIHARAHRFTEMRKARLATAYWK